MDLSEFFNSINKTKVDLLKKDPGAEKNYVPFVVNKSLSYHADAVFHANTMNGLPLLDKKMQYDYFLHRLTKGVRYGKWHKDEDTSLEPIMAFYGYSKTRAKEVARLLSGEQLEAIKEALNTGGS